MKKIGVVAGLLLVAEIAVAQEQPVCQFYTPNGQCAPAVSAPGRNAGLRTNTDLLEIRPPAQKKELIKDALYTVRLNCRNVNFNPQNNPWHLFVEKTRTTSHIIAITNTRIANNQLPTDARAALTVFSVTDSLRNSNTFLNTGCNTSFVIGGKDKIYLAATANQSDSNKPGVLTNIVFELIKITLSIGPLFTNTNFSSHWKAPLEATKDTQEPLGKIIEQLSTGVTVTKPADLYEGMTVVSTPYSRVDITISRIKSLVELGNDRFTGDFEKLIEQARGELKLNTLADAALTSQCQRFAADLISKNLAATDAAFALGYATKLFQLNRKMTLDCLGPNYALPALKYKSMWDRQGGSPYNEEDVRSYFVSTPPWPIQPNFEVVRSVPLERAISALSAYVKSAPALRSDINARLEKYFSNAVKVENFLDLFDFEVREIPPSAIAEKLAEQSRTVIGCLTSDTEGLAVFFAFKPTPAVAGAKHAPSESIALRVWLDANQKVARAKIIEDPGALERALQARGSRFCGPVEVAGGKKE